MYIVGSASGEERFVGEETGRGSGERRGGERILRQENSGLRGAKENGRFSRIPTLFEWVQCQQHSRVCEERNPVELGVGTIDHYFAGIVQ